MSAVETAFQGLRQMMATGQLQAGQRFPIESELCAELGVSRSSLREAVRMLAALGVVEVRQGAGTYVSQLRAADIVRAVHTLLRQNLAGVTSMGVSLMTEGLEATVTPEAMADLLAFLRRGSR